MLFLKFWLNIDWNKSFAFFRFYSFSGHWLVKHLCFSLFIFWDVNSGRLLLTSTVTPSIVRVVVFRGSAPQPSTVNV